MAGCTGWGHAYRAQEDYAAGKIRAMTGRASCNELAPVPSVKRCRIILSGEPACGMPDGAVRSVMAGKTAYNRNTAVQARTMALRAYAGIEGAGKCLGGGQGCYIVDDGLDFALAQSRMPPHERYVLYGGVDDGKRKT